MFNRTGTALGLALSHTMTNVTLNRQKEIIMKKHLTSTEGLINQGEIIETKNLVQAIQPHKKTKRIALALEDDWFEQQSFPIQSPHKRALLFLIKQKVTPGNLYDYQLRAGHCTLWQLSKNLYEHYLNLANAIGGTLKLIEPLSHAQSRIFKQKADGTYAIYFQGPNEKLNVIKNNQVIFSHTVINHEPNKSIQLYEHLQQDKITTVISNDTCHCACKTIIEKVPGNILYQTAISAIKRI